MTMYASTNFKTKKAFKEAVEKGDPISIFSAGIGDPPSNGKCCVSGPHYPQPHTWYAEVTIVNDLVVEVK